MAEKEFKAEFGKFYHKQFPEKNGAFSVRRRGVFFNFRAAKGRCRLLLCCAYAATAKVKTAYSITRLPECSCQYPKSSLHIRNKTLNSNIDEPKQ
jgi:hypothetical protein